MVEAVLAAFLSSDSVLVLPLMVTYLGSNPRSTSTPSSRVGRSRRWPMVAFTSKPEPRYLPMALAPLAPLAGLVAGTGVSEVFTVRLGLVAMNSVCPLESSWGQRRWLQEIRATGVAQGGST